MATLKKGKPYIWVTWVTKLLGGHQCYWSAWFKAHHRYDKVEPAGGDLAAWNRDHTAMMQARRRELEREGFTVLSEQEIGLVDDRATVAGKIDLLAIKLNPPMVLIIDGKTGRERDSDYWQVLFYLLATQNGALNDLHKAVRAVLQDGGALEGELHYKRGDERVSITPSELTPERIAEMKRVVHLIAADTPPVKRPSRDECRFCNIGALDCPQRISQDAPAAAVANW